MIGMAMKAGKVASGEFATEKAVKTGKAYMVIVASDSSDNTKKNFSDMCSYYNVPIYFLVIKKNLGMLLENNSEHHLQYLMKV